MANKLTIFDIADGKQEPLPVSPQFDWEGKRIVEDHGMPPDMPPGFVEMLKDMITELAPSISTELTEFTDGKATTGVSYPPGYRKEAEKVRAYIEQQLDTHDHIECTNDHCTHKIKPQTSSQVSAIMNMNEVLCFCSDNCLNIWWKKLMDKAAALFIKNGFISSKKNSRILGECLPEGIDLNSAYEIARSFYKIKGVTKTKAFAEAILIAKIAQARKIPPFIYLKYFVEGVDDPNVNISTDRDEEETAIYFYRMKQVFASLQEKGLIER